jgi:hypothetical protein
MINFNIEIGKRSNKCPAGEIIFNNETIHSGEYNKNSFELNPVIGANTLSISLKNKNDRDTVLEGNKITKDIFVIVKDIQCQITKDSLKQFDILGSYITDKSEDIKTHGYLSYNGTYTFKFDYPFFIFDKNKIFY